jgi:hypothetical protein
MANKNCIHCKQPVTGGTRNTKDGYLHDGCWDTYFAGREDPSDDLTMAETVVLDRATAKAATSSGAGFSSQTSKYSTARGVSSLVEFLGWSLVVLGVAAMIYSASQNLGVMGVLTGIALSVGGLLQVMGAQVVKATADNADHTREILEILKARQA